MEGRDAIKGSLPYALAAFVVIAVAVAIVVRSSAPTLPELPPMSTSRIEVQPMPSVLLAVRTLARLEGATFHMERVVELTDQQSKLFGLIHTKDALLLVAVGEITAGVDLAKLTEKDVTSDFSTKRATLRLPAPEVFSASLDNAKTHVYARTTESFASRREDLEGRARIEAEAGMRKAAIDGGLLVRARASAEQTLRALLASLGFVDVTIDWRTAS